MMKVTQTILSCVGEELAETAGHSWDLDLRCVAGGRTLDGSAIAT